LFDLRPKTSRDELFDREMELEELHRSVERGYPLIAVLGIRRIGKTSVLKTFLGEIKGIYIDLRGVRSTTDLEERVSDALSSSFSRLRRLIEGIRGVSIAGMSLEIKWRGRDSISLYGLFEELNKKGERLVVVLDELQSSRAPVSFELKQLLAYSYDNLENICFIVAGSEIGLLRDFIGLNDSSSPLYGRHVKEIAVERFTREDSMEFLSRGFAEEGLHPPIEVLEKAVELFDGIVGWLTLYGRSYVDGLTDLERLKDMAVDMALEELNKLSEREKIILKAIAAGSDSWSKVRRYIAERKGVIFPKATLTRTIKKLEKLSLIRDYEFLDPVYKLAALQLRVL